MAKTDFRYSLENFRGIAIIFVMLSHLSSLNTIAAPGKIAHFIVVDATTWFVFISGYLLSHIEFVNKFDFKNYINKKFKFVLIPYLILSIPAILTALYVSRPHFYDLTNFEYTLWALSVGGNVIGPMWFIPMIFLFFVTSPIFYKLNRQLLPILTIICLTFSIFSWRPFNNLNPFFSFAHFLGFYLLGIYFHSIRDNIYNLSIKSALLIILSCLISFIVLLLRYWEHFVIQSNFISFFARIGEFNPMQLGKLLLLISLFFSLEMFLNRKIIVLSKLAQISFGLFFIHGFYMAIFARFIAPITPENPIKLIIEFILIIPFSIYTVNAVKLILKNRSKYVIGC